MKIVIVGGGAAGFFAAINGAEILRQKKTPATIEIFEASDQILKKVRISGGGRCNVTHFQFDSRKFCENYPRGEKELVSVMQRFQAKDTVDWFRNRGVRLVAESDGRMFPDTNTAQTIIDCFLNEAKRLNVQVRFKHSVKSITKGEDRFHLTLANGELVKADKIVLATGSSSQGYDLAKTLGHTITDLAPSLFSFKIEDPMIKGFEGLSFKSAGTKLLVGDAEFHEDGPLLITHWGLSGPAVLKISAWAAREMKKHNYQAALEVNWLGLKNVEVAKDLVQGLKRDNLKAQLSNAYPEELPSRFWGQILYAAQVSPTKKWADLSNKEISELCRVLVASRFQVLGKNRYKDEFVECGGVNLKEVNFKTMESKVCSGLFFAGELLDIDGITGGFNFQNAWSGAYIAANNF